MRVQFHLGWGSYGTEQPSSSSPPMVFSARPRIREIGPSDIDAMVNALTRGFRHHRRTHEFWIRAFKRLSEHDTPAGLPRYGYFLEYEGKPVGVVLLIFSYIPDSGAVKIRCNVSSWYVEPAFRSYAGMLVAHALRHKDITYFNITPVPHTFSILRAQGYLPYCAGRFVCLPVLKTRSSRVSVAEVSSGIHPADDLAPFEIELLLSHAKYGCLSLVCTSAGVRHPFIFSLPRKFGWVPYAYLIYCRELEEFARFAGPVGRFLASRGFFVAVVDANGPLPGVLGRYSPHFPKFFKGPDQPRLGDVAHSERALFGV